MKKVVILQHRLLHYRLSLFEMLKAECRSRSIHLELVHGQPTRRELVKNDTGTLPWAHVVNNRYLEFGERDILWQPYPSSLRDADLVILMQESRLLSNYLWLIGLAGKRARLGYWGHGRNFQADDPAGLREKWKKYFLNKVDWWYAYTDLTRDILIDNRFPSGRITVLDNAIDNEQFVADLASVSQARILNVRQEIGAPEGAPVGLFCGSLYPDKRLDFLVSAAEIIRKSIPDFAMIVIGDGPGSAEIRAAANKHPWMRWVGVRRRQEKAAYFRVADVVLNPGLVGLHVLDSFCAGVPMVTTADARHSPEIAYLRSDVNGLIVSGGVDAYATAVVQLLRDKVRLMSLKKSALNDADRYTLKNMVSRFADGIERCLMMPKAV